MAHCTKCKTDKDDAEFGLKKQANGTFKFQSWCRKCYAAHNNARYHSCAERRASVRAVANGHRERNLDFMKEYLSDKACLHCGEADPVVLEFNHIDPAAKRSAVSVMVHKGLSISTLMAEIEKCEILCANCHRRHTAKQFGYYRGNW